MNLDSTENYDQENQKFQDETNYEGTESKILSPDHTISNNAEPDYGNDLSADEFDNSELGNENLGNENLGNDELDNDALDNDEFETEDEDELGNEELDNERPGDN
jgi:hypothetical protein